MNKKDKLKLRKLMNNYKVNATLFSELHTYGLNVEKTKKHTRIKRCDGVGGMVYIASTPSDWRAGANAAVQIIRLLEAA